MDGSQRQAKAQLKIVEAKTDFVAADRVVHFPHYGLRDNPPGFLNDRVIRIGTPA